MRLRLRCRRRRCGAGAFEVATASPPTTVVVAAAVAGGDEAPLPVSACRPSVRHIRARWCQHPAPAVAAGCRCCGRNDDTPASTPQVQAAAVPPVRRCCRCLLGCTARFRAPHTGPAARATPLPDPPGCNRTWRHRPSHPRRPLSARTFPQHHAVCAVLSRLQPSPCRRRWHGRWGERALATSCRHSHDG